MVKLRRPLSDDFKIKEAYKVLRTNILFCGKNVKTILVTSCVPSEGKSTVSINIAVSMAELGKRVLLIDADLRRPSIVKRIVSRKKLKGLTHYFSGQSEIDDIVNHTEDGNLDIILTGAIPPNPSELLASDDFKNLIKTFHDEYDYIIIDTPPLGSVIDSAVIAENCDGAIILLESGKDSYKFVNSVKDQLSRSGCKILGVVLNKCSPKKSSSYYYYNGNYSSAYK